MSEIVFTIGFIVWLVAALAFVRLAMSFAWIWRASPVGQGSQTALELWSLNYPAVRQRVGVVGAPAVETFRKSLGLCAVCTAALIVLVLFNIVTGNAA